MSTADLLFGIDLGTTGTRAVLYTAEGAVLASAGAETPLHWHGPGAVDQDPDDFYDGATRAMAECMERSQADPARVAGIGICGQMAGVLGVDARWQPAMPYDSWLDVRCAADVDVLTRDLGDAVVELTGCPPMVNHAPKLLWWKREHPPAYAKTAKFLMPSGYVAGKLAGLTAADAFIDRTYLHFTGLADARYGLWSDRLATALDISTDKLPRIVEPATVIGYLTAEAAALCGLHRGVPVAAGLGDTAAGALGAGVVRPRQLLDTAGTAAVFAASIDTFQSDTCERTLIVMRGALDGQWIALSYLSGGSLLSWFRSVLIGDAGAAGDSDLDGFTAGFATIAPGSDGLLFIPHLDGRVLPSDPLMGGAWVGLHRHHGQGHLGHAILESVAYEYAGYLRLLSKLHPDITPEETRVVGGGARSALWNRIKASVLGVPYVRLDRDEVSCWGAALVAGSAVGLFADLAQVATRSTPVKDYFEPNWEEHAVYTQMSAQYRVVVEALATPSRALATLRRGGPGEAR